MSYTIEGRKGTADDVAVVKDDETGRVVATLVLHGTGHDTAEAHATLFSYADLESHPAHQGPKPHVQPAAEARERIAAADKLRAALVIAAQALIVELGG